MEELLNENPEQRTLDWYRKRLGKFNASQVHLLMASGKKEVFGKTALAYIDEVAAERLLAPEIVNDDEMFSLYLDMNSNTNKFMAWGSEQEDAARQLYQERTGNVVTLVGSVTHQDMPYFACSSDGIVNERVCGIEIKCPTAKTYVSYMRSMHKGESLKDFKPEYWWQIQSQIEILNLDYVDWTLYCPFMREPMQIYRIKPDDKDINKLIERVQLAEQVINNI